MDLGQTLLTLSGARGVSGDEREAVGVAAAFLRPLVDEIQFTPLGSLLGFRRSQNPHAKTVLLDAHLDEVGLVITGQEAGLFQIHTGVGGVDSRLLPGQVVTVLTQPPMYGVITCPDAPADQKTPFALTDLRIDCGLEEAEAEDVPVGTRVSYGTEPWRAGTDRICGKSLDNRACFAALLRALELTQGEALPVHVAVLGSVQEERGGAGALTGTFAVRPDAALVVDVTFGDSPDTPAGKGFPLGSGAAIGYSPVLDRRMSRFLQTLAVRRRIPYVQEIMETGTGTNSMHTQIAGTGVPSGLISMPLRYMHTPVEEISLRDVEAMGQLVAEFLRHFEEAAQ